MAEQETKDDVLILDKALICSTEPGGEGAFELEADVLLLTNALTPEPVVKNIDVGRRISNVDLVEVQAKNKLGDPSGWNIVHPPKPATSPVRQPSFLSFGSMPVNEKAPNLGTSDETTQPISSAAGTMDLGHLVAEARAFASDYCIMNVDL